MKKLWILLKTFRNSIDAWWHYHFHEDLHPDSTGTIRCRHGWCKAARRAFVGGPDIRPPRLTQPREGQQIVHVWLAGEYYDALPESQGEWLEQQGIVRRTCNDALSGERLYVIADHAAYLTFQQASNNIREALRP